MSASAFTWGMPTIRKIVIEPTGVVVGYCDEGREWRDGKKYDRPRPPLAPDCAVYVFDGREMHDKTDVFRCVPRTIYG